MTDHTSDAAPGVGESEEGREQAPRLVLTTEALAELEADGFKPCGSCRKLLYPWWAKGHSLCLACEMLASSQNDPAKSPSPSGIEWY